MNTLEEILAELATARMEMENTINSIREYESRWKSSPEYTRMVELREKATIEVDRLTKLAKDSAVDIYIATGNKKPADGVQIKIFTEYAIDETQAMAWAETKMPIAIKKSLDEALLIRTFEKTSDNDLPSWVTRSLVPKAQISKILTP